MLSPLLRPSGPPRSLLLRFKSSRPNRSSNPTSNPTTEKYWLTMPPSVMRTFCNSNSTPSTTSSPSPPSIESSFNPPSIPDIPPSSKTDDVPPVIANETSAVSLGCSSIPSITSVYSRMFRLNSLDNELKSWTKRGLKSYEEGIKELVKKKSKGESTQGFSNVSDAARDELAAVVRDT